LSDTVDHDTEWMASITGSDSQPSIRNLLVDGEKIKPALISQRLHQ